jgi:hypothetical protein|tara:strand:- start:859 stop:1443 length:585 start_codon:yes stop_codon:yes gene_type:complete
MANKDAPFGFRPTKMLGGAPFNGSQTEYGIASTYNTNIFSGDAVELHTDGTVTIAAAGQTNILGVFNGCFYTDSTGAPNWSKYWPASTTSTDAVAFVVDDPNVLFEAQEDSTDIGASWPANRGSNANFVSTHAGSTKTGRSKQELDSDNITAATANFRIVELSKDPDNSDTASANCNFLVRVNEGLYYDNAAGI